MIAHAGWIIDLAPGAGHDDGGGVAFGGTPADLVASRSSSTLTGEHLAVYVGA